MPSKYLLEDGSGGYLLESGAGYYLLDAPPWTPAELSGGALKSWLQGDLLTGTNGSDVTSWADSSGNSLAASGSGNDPTLTTASLNSMNTVNFAAANIDQMLLPNGAVSAFTEGAVFFVAKSAAETKSFPEGSALGLFGSGAPGDDSYPNASGHVASGFLSSTSKDCGDPGSVSSWHVGGFRSKTGDWRYRFNGADAFTTTSNTFAAATGFPRLGGPGGGYYWDGDIAEVVLCNSFLTAEQTQLIEGYLAWKWGLQASLAAGHAWASEQPPTGASQGAINYTLTATPGAYSLTGQSMAPAIRVPLTPGAYAITGTAMAPGISLPATPGVYAIGGQAITLRRALPLAPGTYNISGQTVALAWGRRLSITPGAYSISGQAVGLSRGRLIAAAPGAYTLTGTAITPRLGRAIAATPGAYAITGQAAALKWAHAAALAPGAYALTGQAATLRIAIGLTPGAYALAGGALTLRRGYNEGLATGAYNIAGQSIALLVARHLALNPGAYSLTGQAMVGRKGLFASMAPGAYAITGQAITIRRVRKLAAAAGAYRIYGGTLSAHIAQSLFIADIAPVAAGLVAAPAPGPASAFSPAPTPPSVGFN